ncbi:type I restriction-modification system subunit M N-terminal domain-containing protein [Xanthomarina spongicola]|uniref:Type I restriction enzyme M protein n=1 Tax=Xanthomarina spongicola TaxID=570520 RepID=A0A316DKC0_9FLAO|nr:type I restriction-modification system subunit M N-terminal domain-containing protein [Xanthomarina spongicola]PWK18561.1 type I restriction enzyme M protein [Xanthomarina spongicola]
MTKNQSKADINFEQELWKAANELRGAVAENQYKDYILPLIFLKHVSERYELRRDTLIELFKDEASDYYTSDVEEQKYVLEDPDEYLSKSTYIIPEKADVKPKDLMPILIEKGFFNQDLRIGLPLRNVLRDLDEVNLLYLLPQVRVERKETNRFWFFNPLKI